MRSVREGFELVLVAILAGFVANVTGVSGRYA